jgi:hypothetical protein
MAPMPPVGKSGDLTATGVRGVHANPSADLACRQ